MNSVSTLARTLGTALLALLVAAPSAAFAQDGGAAGVAGCYALEAPSGAEVPAHLRLSVPLPTHLRLSPLPSRDQMAWPGSLHVAYPPGYPYFPFLSWRVAEDGRVRVSADLRPAGVDLVLRPGAGGVLEGGIRYSTDALAHDPHEFEQDARLVPAPPEHCDTD